MNWVLLRGLGRESGHWLDFAKKLAPDSEVLCLDLPGVGDERHADAPTQISRMTDYVRTRFLEKRRSEKPWGLLAISLGGMVAMDWLKRFPEDFVCSVIINSSAKDLSPAIQRFLPFAWYCFVQANFKRDIRKRELQILKMVSNKMKNDPEVLRRYCEIHEMRPVTLLTLSRQIFAASRFQSPSKIETPLLILASNKDRMVDVRCSRSLAERLNATIKFHPSAGHDLALDDPDWVIERIFDFLAAYKILQ